MKEKSNQYYRMAIDEETPVWNKDVEEMQRIYVAKDPSARRGTKFTKWEHVYLNSADEWIWVSDDANTSGAIFKRRDNQFELIAEVGTNRTPSVAKRDDTGYLRVSGSAGGSQHYQDIYVLDFDKPVQHFHAIDNNGALESCTLNGKQISIEQGHDFLNSLPAFGDLTF